jgi:hypothetical protein
LSEALAGAAVALATADSDGPVWNELVRTGDHHGRSGGRNVPLSLSDLQAMERNFRDVVQAEGWYPVGAPITFNHAGLKGALDAESTKAAGFITELRVVPNGDGTHSLHGLTDWTDEGRRRVRAREFQGFSIEFLPAGKAHSKTANSPVDGALLFGGTLTNNPFVPGLSAVAAAEATPTPAPASEPAPIAEIRMKTVTAHLGLSEDAAEATILAEINKIAAEKDALATALDEATTKQATTAKALDDAIGQRDALQSEKDARVEADKVALLDSFVSDGRIANTDEAKADAWAVVSALGEDKARSLYPKDGEFRTAPTGHDGGRAPETGAVGAEQAFDATYNEAIAAGENPENAYNIARDKHAAALAGRYSKEA